MSDNLVAQLRSIEQPGHYANVWSDILHDAADRIEELEGRLNLALDYQTRVLAGEPPHLEIIETLRSRIIGLEAMLVDADKHGQKLEAALHEIIAWWESEDEDIKVMEIATRALRGKS